MEVDYKGGSDNDFNEALENVELIEIIENEEPKEIIENEETKGIIENEEPKEIIENEEPKVIIEKEEPKVTFENDQPEVISEIEKTQEPQEHKEIDAIKEQNELSIETKENSKKHGHKNISQKFKKVIVRTLVSIITVIVLLFFDLLGIVMITNYGPSETARNLFVDSVMESSAGKFMATLFFSDEKIAEIRAINSVVVSAEVTDPNLIAVNQIASESKTEDKPIEIIDIVASTYKGKLVIVRDPSRVTVGVSGNYGGSNSGKTVKDMALAYNAIIAINGGGFEDASGVGNGGTPIGIVISEGKLKYGSLATTYEVIGFDNENKLVVGKMTGRQALDRGIRDALSFGPILIVNGTSSVINGSGSGVNPRTAIGQRADGAMLLLVIDGRQTNSAGATYADLVEIMLEYGAVNAANLDGGSSTVLYYNGDYINKNSSINGPRNMPTSIIVR